MPHLVVIGAHEGQRRQLEEQLAGLAKNGYQLTGKTAFTSWGALFENALSGGLFAEKQVVVSEASEALGPFPEELVKFLEPEGAASVIIAVLEQGSRGAGQKQQRRFPEAALSRITEIKAEPTVPPWKRKQWLMGLARSGGLRISPDAASLLGESIESTEELRSELKKLGIYAGKREISVADVRELSFDEGARALMTFLDGLCRNQPKDVARALGYLRERPMLTVLTPLCNRLRPAMYMAVFPKSEAAALKALGMDRGKDYAVRMAKSALGAFGPERIMRFMMRAARLSFLEKTSRAEGWPGFELCVWELMG